MMIQRLLLCALLSAAQALVAQQPAGKTTNLPTSKLLSSTPNRLAFVNSFPATIALSPDGAYAALLNDGFGTQESNGHQSISILDLKTNTVADFPDQRLGPDAHQSYFVGLAFSSEGKHLYASIGSITDPTGKKAGDTGNGIAVYSFDSGKVTPERFIKIGPQAIAPGKFVSRGLFKLGPGFAIPFPAGLAVISGEQGDKLLVANNYADNVVLMDAATGNVLKTFDLSTTKLIPGAFPYAVMATRDGKRAWCSLWNQSRVVELDLQRGKIARFINLQVPDNRIAPGSHPTALLLSPSEKMLYVALANADQVIGVPIGSTSKDLQVLHTTMADMKFRGTVPTALAISPDG